MTAPPRVTVVGGGLAGLTAALRLAERGCRVTVYEREPVLGGNLRSRPPAGRTGGPDLDVYPHMFCNWYRNFWQLYADVTASPKETRFEPYEGYSQLARGQFPHFTRVTDMYSWRHALQNAFSGVGPPADLWVFGYAGIDLLAERLNPTMCLREATVEGFLDARPYMTSRAAAAYDAFITRVWAIPSYLASADAFRLYLRYAFADPTPAFWLPRGPAQRQVIAPLTAALQRHGVEIVPAVQMNAAACAQGRVERITLQRTRTDPRSGRTVGTGRSFDQEVDELILAVPPLQLVKLIRAGAPGRRIVEAAPDLSQVARLRSVPVPIINLFFTRRLLCIPAEPVGLLDSPSCLAFTDISQTWQGVGEFADRTVLAVSASDLYALPGTGAADDAHAMLAELAEYLAFDPGREWGGSPDIDWTLTDYRPNDDAQLFVNEAGSEAARPAAQCATLANLCFAGDFCANEIGMTTVESAVASGLLAAGAVVARRGLGPPVRPVRPDLRAWDQLWAVWARYAVAPSAGAASAWSRGRDLACRLGRWWGGERAGQRRDSRRT